MKVVVLARSRGARGCTHRVDELLAIAAELGGHARVDFVAS